MRIRLSRARSTFCVHSILGQENIAVIIGSVSHVPPKLFFFLAEHVVLLTYLDRVFNFGRAHLSHVPRHNFGCRSTADYAEKQRKAQPSLPKSHPSHDRVGVEMNVDRN